MTALFRWTVVIPALQVLLISLVQTNHLSPTLPFLSLSVVDVRVSPPTLLFNVFSYFRLFFLISSGIIFPALHPIFSSSPAIVCQKHD